MTPQEFGTWLVGYYGQIPEGQKKDLWDYIKMWSESYLDAMKKVLMENFSSQFKTPPDIAIFKKFEVDAIRIQSETMGPVKELPAPATPLTPEMSEKMRKFNADLDELGITEADPRWMSKVFNLRVKQGDYRQGGGIIRGFGDLDRRPRTD